MLRFVGETSPSRDELTDWIISNTRANSSDAINHHLAFLQSIELLHLSDSHCELAEYGERYLENNDQEILYEALSSGVKGFDKLLEALAEGAMADEDIKDLLVQEFEEAEMETTGPAARHREWLQSLGFVRRSDGVNELTETGRALFDSSGTPDEQLKYKKEEVSQLRSNLLQNEMACVSPGQQHLSEDIYPAVKSTYPELCDDEFLCDEAHDSGKQHPEWKHAVRDIQQRIADREWGRIRRLNERGMWLYLPYFEQGQRYVRSELHDEYGGQRQRGISPCREIPIVLLFPSFDQTREESKIYPNKLREDGSVIMTGEGKTGKMTLDHGNAAVVDHQEEGRVLHIFEDIGDGQVEYLGKYECHEWFREELPDEEGEIRSAIRFELEPIESSVSSSNTTEAENIDQPATENGVGDSSLPDGSEVTERRETTTSEIQRERDIVRQLKRLYNDTCMICGDRRLQAPDEGYSQVHHLMPLGEPHDGPDIPENVIVVCPNHHEDFEHGMLTIDPQTLEIEHNYEDYISGQRLQTKGDHEIGAEYLAYHNQVISNE
jgi:predicted HNH restriction endonuclease